MNTKHLLRAVAVALAGAILNVQAGVTIPESCKTGGFFLGCQAYTFNQFTVFEAIEKTEACGGKVIEFFPGQRLSLEEPTVKWDHNSSDEVIAKVQAKLKKHNIVPVNYGVVGIPKDEAAARKIFEFAKKLNLRAVTTESTDAIDTIEKLVKEYDIMTAYHNHPRQPNNPKYQVWDPNYIMELVKDRDPRIGACADTGHWVRSGLKPVECLKILKGRVISSHLKDRKSQPGEDVHWGLGVSDVPGILEELHAQGFAGNISIEYEFNWKQNVTDAAACMGFVRGYGAAKGWK